MFPISHFRERVADLAARDDIDMAGVQEMSELHNLLPQLCDYDDEDNCVPASELVAYATELARGQGQLDPYGNDRWPLGFIDWEAAAEELILGTFTLRNVTYHVV